MATYSSPSIDLDRNTGGQIEGWAHVVQSLQDIFTMRFGELVMGEYYGSAVPALLGRPMNADTIVRFLSAMTAAIEQWEPRVRVTQITPTAVGRDGAFRFELELEHRPRALLGDFTAEGARRVSVGASGSGVTIERDA